MRKPERAKKPSTAMSARSASHGWGSQVLPRRRYACHTTTSTARQSRRNVKALADDLKRSPNVPPVCTDQACWNAPAAVPGSAKPT